MSTACLTAPDSVQTAPSLHSRLYRSLYRIRRVEEEVARVYPSDKIKSPVHLSIGQEAVSVGVCEALKPQDIVFGTYRSHAAYLAKGGGMNGMIAELYGKSGGCAKGKGGSMHLVDIPRGIMGASAVVGSTIPNAVGYAYAAKLAKKDLVVACFFGDGATEEGVFFESLNFAALKDAPVIFVCENNGYAIHTHVSRRQKKTNLCDKAREFGLESHQIKDNDTLAIYDAAKAAADAIRRGASGPVFLECLTYRWKEHVGPNEDFNLGYRTKAEAQAWMQADELPRLAALVDAEERRHIETEAEAEIAAAFAFAESSPAPALSELYANVFKGA